ncbi:DUF1003 domain-containing protein [Schaalia hyovaginalis]|uniref:DUF1003 domain-containing protein n=1 Tax=Schaalia hyovaginalis TaxID=29316 RepID=UPI002A76272A|nr:DUF1003 domain-containing protein [Schaalia hyovaginalis]MDY2669526.1 DUF1003 domain-containing protein [Schaalia hyovaginalis]
MADRLDTPRERGFSWFRRRTRSSDGFGRFAEATARFMGSPRFILYMTIFVVSWIAANVVLHQVARAYAWDEYPFILLNLAFSTQASYSAPLILLAQNRQADRDRVQAEQDRQRAERNLADTEFLTREIASLRLSVQEVATRDFVRSELRDLLDDLREDIRAQVRAELEEEYARKADAAADPDRTRNGAEGDGAGDGPSLPAARS